jgi:hypothetical protein
MVRWSKLDAVCDSYVQSLAAKESRNPKGADVVPVQIVRGASDPDKCLLTRRFEGSETLLALAEATVPRRVKREQGVMEMQVLKPMANPVQNGTDELKASAQ